MYEQYEQALGLRWLVAYVVKPQETTCRINCQIALRRHEVWLHVGVLQDRKKFLPDVVHELCHAWLGENVDPAFATVFFSKRYGKLTGDAYAEFEQKARMLYWAHAHVDIWVNELRHRHFPELTEADAATFSGSVKALAKLGRWDDLRTRESVVSLAMYLAEAKRYPFESVNMASILHGMGTEWKRLTLALTAFYEILPRLAYERVQDLKSFEQSVQEAAKIWEFPIEPSLVEEEGIAVWLV